MTVQSALSSSLSCIENCRPSGLGCSIEAPCAPAAAPRLTRGGSVECSVSESSCSSESSRSTCSTSSELIDLLLTKQDSFGRRRRAETPGEDLVLSVRSSGASPTGAAGGENSTDAAGGEMASSTCRLRLCVRRRAESAAAGLSSQQLEGPASLAWAAAGGGGVTCGRRNESAGDGLGASGSANRTSASAGASLTPPLDCVSSIACRSQRSPGRPSGRAPGEAPQEGDEASPSLEVSSLSGERDGDPLPVEGLDPESPAPLPITREEDASDQSSAS